VLREVNLGAEKKGKWLIPFDQIEQQVIVEGSGERFALPLAAVDGSTRHRAPGGGPCGDRDHVDAPPPATPRTRARRPA